MTKNLAEFVKAIKKLKKENKGYWSFEMVKDQLADMGCGSRWTDKTIKSSLIEHSRVNYTVLEALRRAIRSAKYNNADYVLEGKIIVHAQNQA